jgi:plasmid stabilization system protein ParE
MIGYILSVEAEEDTFQIWCYLAEKASVETANRIESRLYKAFELLVKTPALGHKRSDLTQHPVLFFRVRPYSYLIVYRPKTPLEIVAVLHGKRNVEVLLQDRIGRMLYELESGELG